MPAFIQLHFAHPPQRFQLLQQGQTLWEEQDPTGRQFEADLTLQLSDRLAELQLQVEWPEGTGRSAVELIVEPDALSTQRFSLWDTDRLNERVLCSWP